MTTPITGQGLNVCIPPDDELSLTSKKPAQNKVITEELTDLSNAISQIKDIVIDEETFFYSDWWNGYYARTGAPITSTQRVSFSPLLPLEKDSTVEIVCGSGEKFARAAWVQTDSGLSNYLYGEWETGTREWVIDRDSLISVVVTRLDGSDFTTSEVLTTAEITSIRRISKELDAIREEVYDLNIDVTTINKTCIRKNLIGMNPTVLYPVSFTQNENITMSTSDGSVMATTLRLNFYNSEGQHLNYYDFTQGLSKRTVTITSSIANAKFISWANAYSVPLQVEHGQEATEYQKYFYTPDELTLKIDTINDELAVVDSHVDTFVGYFKDPYYNKWELNAWGSGGTIVTSTNKIHLPEIYLKAGDRVQIESDTYLIGYYEKRLSTGVEYTRSFNQTLNYTATEDVCLRVNAKHSDDSDIVEIINPPSVFVLLTETQTKAKNAFDIANYLSEFDAKGFLTISADDMEFGTYDTAYHEFPDRCRYKYHYLPAKAGDSVVLNASDGISYIVAICEDPDAGGTPIFSSGWVSTSRTINIEKNGYYILLANVVKNNFAGTFQIYRSQSGESVDPQYASEIEATIASVNALQTEPCVVFPLCTDIHHGVDSLNQNIVGKMIENMRAVIKKIRADAVVCLGDLTEGDNNKTEGYMLYISELFRSLNVPYLLAIGNHDDNRYSNTDVFTSEQMYQYYNAFTENTVFFNSRTNGRDFYYDLPAHKVRFVSIDSNTVGAYGFSSDTVTWFTNTALDTPDDYTVVVLVHESPVNTHNYSNSGLNNSTGIKDAIIAYQTSGKPILELYGHSHCDVAFSTPYLDIGTNCAKFENTNGDPALWPEGATKPSRTIGTVTEDCWDVVILRPLSRKINLVRFGAGNDREYTY